MSQKTRLMIVTDHHLFGECLTSVLTAQEDIATVELVVNSVDVQNEVRTQQPDIVLIDSNLPSKSALELARRTSQELPHVKVIILGLAESNASPLDCIEAGARAFVLKESSINDLRTAIQSVSRGETVCPPQIAYSTFSRVAELAR